ncbi:MAG: A24 family peptidase C-terminal domain-containing protein, partial [Candidatus Bathyarchaeia archaeon]
METLSNARVILSLIFLVYASWSDFKKREVENWVWMVFAPLAFALTFTELFPDLQSLLWYAVSFGLTSLLAVCLFYVGAFGGADAKAFMCIALALPFPPYTTVASPVFPLTVFSNSVVLAALSVFYMIFRNLLWTHKTKRRLFEGFEKEPFWRKFLTFLSGYKVSAKKLVEKDYVYPLEDVGFNNPSEMKRVLLVFPRDDGRDDIVKRVYEASEKGRIPEHVWASPGLPMIIFVTLGLILALFFGD